MKTLKLNGYQTYLRYKKTMEFLQTGKEFTRITLREHLDIRHETVAGVINVLLKEKLIKLVRYDLVRGHRIEYYKEIKHD